MAGRAVLGSRVLGTWRRWRRRIVARLHMSPSDRECSAPRTSDHAPLTARRRRNGPALLLPTLSLSASLLVACGGSSGQPPVHRLSNHELRVGVSRICTARAQPLNTALAALGDGSLTVRSFLRYTTTVMRVTREIDDGIRSLRGSPTLTAKVERLVAENEATIHIEAGIVRKLRARSGDATLGDAAVTRLSRQIGNAGGKAAITAATAGIDGLCAPTF